MPFGVTCQVEFDAAHRLIDYVGKCAAVHGHSYVATVTVRCDKLDDCGMGLDFAVLKGGVKRWIDANWDHNLILHRDDPLLFEQFRDGNARVLSDPELIRRFGRVPSCVSHNPTAENMAKFLFQIVRDLILSDHPDLTVEKVTIQETRACSASYQE